MHSIPAYRNIVKKMLQSPQTLENIGAQTRDLKVANMQ